MSETSLIQYAENNGIATLTLNRPEKRNAMSDAMRAELVEHLQAIRTNRGIRALIVTGSNKKGA